MDKAYAYSLAQAAISQEFEVSRAGDAKNTMILSHNISNLSVFSSELITVAKNGPIAQSEDN
jgi:hypothetical protein